MWLGLWAPPLSAASSHRGGRPPHPSPPPPSSPPAASCSTYVVGSYNCPQQIGNRLHVVLNAKLLSWVLQRTLVWQPDTSNGVFECDRYLVRRSDVASLHELPACNVSSWPHRPFLTNRDWEQRQYLETHAWPNASANAIWFCGKMERHILGQALLQNAHLPRDVRSRLERLLVNGSYHAYGQAFSSLFSFGGLVRDQVAHLPEMTIAIHVRNFLVSQRASHGNATAQDGRLSTMVQAASDALDPGQRCTAFIASDREETVHAFMRSRLPCEKFSLLRNASTMDREKRKVLDRGLHGRYVDMFVAELSLFAKARIAIGTKESSASELALAIAATNDAELRMCSDTACSRVT